MVVILTTLNWQLGPFFKMEFQSAVINRIVKNIDKNNNGLYTCVSFDPSIIVNYFHLDIIIYFVIVQHHNLVKLAQITCMPPCIPPIGTHTCNLNNTLKHIPCRGHCLDCIDCPVSAAVCN